jgi:hypothetical protein
MIPRLFMDTLALRTAYGNVEIHGNVENTLIHTGNNTLQMDRDRGFFYTVAAYYTDFFWSQVPHDRVSFGVSGQDDVVECPTRINEHDRIWWYDCTPIHYETRRTLAGWPRDA